MTCAIRRRILTDSGQGKKIGHTISVLASQQGYYNDVLHPRHKH